MHSNADVVLAVLIITIKLTIKIRLIGWFTPRILFGNDNRCSSAIFVITLTNHNRVVCP